MKLHIGAKNRTANADAFAIERVFVAFTTSHPKVSLGGNAAAFAVAKDVKRLPFAFRYGEKLRVKGLFFAPKEITPQGKCPTALFGAENGT